MKILSQSFQFVAALQDRTSSDDSPASSSSGAVLLSCTRPIFNSSIIPELVTNETFFEIILNLPSHSLRFEELVQDARRWLALFASSDTFQFSSRMIVLPKQVSSSNSSNNVNTQTSDDHARLTDFHQQILLPLINEKQYFTRTLQRCVVLADCTEELIIDLSRVKSLSHLEVRSLARNSDGFPALKHFRNLEHLRLDCFFINPDDITNLVDEIGEQDEENVENDVTIVGRNIFTTVRSLDIREIDCSTEFVSHFKNLTSLVIQKGVEIDLDVIVNCCPHLSTLEIDGQYRAQKGKTCPAALLQPLASLQCIRSLKLIHFSKIERVRGLNFLESLQDTLSVLSLAEMDFVDDENISNVDDQNDRTVAFRTFKPLSCLHLLSSLDLSFISFEFDDTAMVHLSHLTNLRILLLKGLNRISADGLLHLKNLSNFETVDLTLCAGVSCRGEVTKGLPALFFDSDRHHQSNDDARKNSSKTPFPQLRELLLSSCDLADCDLVNISNLKGSLEVLVLSFNKQITSVGMDAEVGELVNLTLLWTVGTSKEQGNYGFLKKLRRMSDFSG